MGGVTVSNERETYDSLSHAKLSVRYHVVLATKFRKRCLLPIKDDLYTSVEESLSGKKVQVLQMGVDEGDHIHILLRVRDPRLSIGKLVQQVKSYTTVSMWRLHPDVLSRHYWKPRHAGNRLWSGGYFVASVGNDFDVVEKYVARQR